METTKEQIELIVLIAKRADKMGLMAFDRMSLIMDLQTANDEFNLRLQEFLDADDYNFAHDIVGIQNNINRLERKMENIFVPRYASNQSDDEPSVKAVDENE